MTPQPTRSILARAAQALRGHPGVAQATPASTEQAAPSAPKRASDAPAPPGNAPRQRPTSPRRSTVDPTGGLSVHRVRGRDLVDALERAARQFGSDVFVLTREPAPDGGVTVTVGRSSGVEGAGSAGSSGAPAAEAVEPGRRDVERLLRRAGASEELLARTLTAIDHSGARGAFAIDAAAQTLGSLVRIAPSPRVRRRSVAGTGSAPHLIAFVGPAGVGKTTTLLKLATRLARSGRRIALVTTDVRSIAGRAQLQSAGKLLQVPVVATEDIARLARSLAQARHVEAVLIDTGGRSPRDGAALSALARELEAAVRPPQLDALAQAPMAAAPPTRRSLLRRAPRAPAPQAPPVPAPSGPTLDVYLTLSAGSSRASLESALLGFDAARPSALVLTKLDEIEQHAPAMEFVAATGVPLAFLCDGAEISAHLHRPTADAVADLFLRGKLSR